MTDWPTPGGTVVRARHPELGTPMRSACRGHLYRTLSSATAVSDKRSECHYVQAAECLVCGYVTPQIDADFFTEASDDDITDCVYYVGQIIELLMAKRDNLSSLLNRVPAFTLPVDL